MTNLPQVVTTYAPVRFIQVWKWQLPLTTVVATLAVVMSALVGVFGGIEVHKNTPEPLYLMDKASIFVKNEAAFEKKVRLVSDTLGIPPEWLMSVMYSESRFDHRAKNLKGSGAVGLIQFMPATAKDMGTTTQKLSAMSNVVQLDLVCAYLMAYKYKYGDYESLTELYLAILYPKALSGDQCYVMYAQPSKAYHQNAGLDEDKDGRVTVSDIDRRMQRVFPKGYIAREKKQVDEKEATQQFTHD